MKILRSTLFCLALVYAGVPVRADDVPGVAALRATPSLPRLDAITLDGDLTDWGKRGLQLPFLTPDSPRIPDPARSRASARFAWDDSGLLIAVEVTDTTPSEAHLASAAYTADSLELFLAPDPTKPDSVQLVLSPGRDPAHPAPRAYVFDNRPAPLQALPNKVTWAVKPRTDGYAAEARLPWAALGIRPAPGLTIGTRLYVNDDDGAGTRTRFVWQPAPGGARYHALTLAKDGASRVLDAPAVWTALDVVDTTARVNMMGRAALAGTAWQVRQGDALLGVLTLQPAGDGSHGSLMLPAGRASGSLTLSGPDDAVLTVRDTLAEDAAGVIARASGGRVSPVDSKALAFARAQFPQHIFVGRRFPSLDFGDPARVARLLGAAPVIVTRWLDAEGRDVTAPNVPGRYAARSEITLPGRANPLILEHVFYRMPDGAGLPSATDEVAARLFAFGLQGAEATPTQSARVAERWWHGVRRARGWSEALAYKIHVPAGAAAKPRPLIVHLHGSGQHSELAVSERLPLLIEQAGPEPIIVYPQSPGGWRGPAVGELIDMLARQHSIDAARVYLVGFSLGGIGSWEVALDQPERFAAVVPIGGRMGSPADAPLLKDVPIWVFNGEFDPGTTTEEAGIMVDALRRAGGKPRFTILPGLSHGESQDAAYRYPGMFKWMLEQRR
jgi:predicted esterase